MAVKGDRAIWEAESEGIALLNTTFGEVLEQQVQRSPDKEALVYNYPELGLNLRLNYRQFRDEVDRLSKGLMALDIAKGDHVAVWAPNVPEWIFLQLSLARIGAVMVTVNTAYKASELEYVLRQGNITTLFMTEAFRGNSYLDSVYSIVPEMKDLADPIAQPMQRRDSAAPETSRLAWHDSTPRYTAVRTGCSTGPAHVRCSSARATSQRDTARRGDDHVHQRNDRLP